MLSVTERLSDFYRASTSFDLWNTCIKCLFRRLGRDVGCSGRAPRIHLRQGANGGESHIDYAFNTFSKRFVGACDGLEGK